MHELYLAESILNIVHEYATQQHFSKVNSISLSFGRLSCIESSLYNLLLKCRQKNTSAEMPL